MSRRSKSLKIGLFAIAIVAVAVLVVMVIGWSLPVQHQASREASFPAAPEVVYSAITDVGEFPKWRSNVDRAERVSIGDTIGIREMGSDGTILYSIEEAVPGRRLVTRIADRSLPFGGSWTYELSPSQSGTTLRITENGEVYNPFFRFMSRFVFGHHATIDAYLRDLRTLLAKKR